MRSSSGRSSSASTPNPSSAAAPSAAPGAAPPPPAASSLPTMPANPPSPLSPATNAVTSSPSTTGPPSSTPSPGMTSPSFWRLPANCDGLLLSRSYSGSRLTLYNPATREHASLRCPPWDFNIVGMYPHRPTGEYRLLLRRCDLDSSKDEIGCYVLPLGSDQPPRYIGCPETEVMSALFNVPVWARHSLHWYPVPCPSESDLLEYETESAPLEYQAELELVIVFDTIAESFRQMRAPLAPTNSCIFEVDDMLGIYSSNRAKEIVDIWVLQNYESEIWDLKYRVELPLAEIRGKLEVRDGDGYWYVTVASGDGDVLLLVRFGHWLLYVDTDGKLVASFQGFDACKYGLKQTLVPHDFFTTREGYAADASPFV